MTDDDDDDDEDDDGPFVCWCGAEGAVEEMFDYSTLDRTCGGTGTLNCYCGGDFCICHHHGSTECLGCPDCEADDDDGWDDFYDED